MYFLGILDGITRPRRLTNSCVTRRPGARRINGRAPASPLIIIIMAMGLVVGFIVLAIVLPMMELNQMQVQ